MVRETGRGVREWNLVERELMLLLAPRRFRVRVLDAAVVVDRTVGRVRVIGLVRRRVQRRQRLDTEEP